jgi:hypothetical protein
MATLVAVSGIAWAVIVVAQGPGAVPATTKVTTSVAVVDLKYIFDNLPPFKDAMERIKLENKTFEAQVNDRSKS